MPAANETGYEVLQVKYGVVITSHFHYDHTGYLRLFTNAEVVSGREILEVMEIASVLGIHAATSAAPILLEEMNARDDR